MLPKIAGRGFLGPVLGIIDAPEPGAMGNQGGLTRRHAASKPCSPSRAGIQPGFKSTLKKRDGVSTSKGEAVPDVQ